MFGISEKFGQFRRLSASLMGAMALFASIPLGAKNNAPHDSVRVVTGDEQVTYVSMGRPGPQGYEYWCKADENGKPTGGWTSKTPEEHEQDRVEGTLLSAPLGYKAAMHLAQDAQKAPAKDFAISRDNFHTVLMVLTEDKNMSSPLHYGAHADNLIEGAKYWLDHTGPMKGMLGQAFEINAHAYGILAKGWEVDYDLHPSYDSVRGDALARLRWGGYSSRFGWSPFSGDVPGPAMELKEPANLRLDDAASAIPYLTEMGFENAALETIILIKSRIAEDPSMASKDGVTLTSIEQEASQDFMSWNGRVPTLGELQFLSLAEVQWGISHGIAVNLEGLDLRQQALEESSKAGLGQSEKYVPRSSPYRGVFQKISEAFKGLFPRLPKIVEAAPTAPESMDSPSQ